MPAPIIPLAIAGYAAFTALLLSQTQNPERKAEVKKWQNEEARKMRGARPKGANDPKGPTGP